MLTEAERELVESYDQLLCQPGFGLDSENAYLPERLTHFYANLGYFSPGVSSLGDACRQLIEHAVAKLSCKPSKILDVACGVGGTTAYLKERFPNAEVHGINISKEQIKLCERRVPGAHFQVMRAEQLLFDDSTFDAVICVEAALHFKGRHEFFVEALRVLRPGGEMVISDMPFFAQPKSFSAILAGQELYADLDEYRALLDRSGVGQIEIEDVTRPVWRGFCRHCRNTAFKRFHSGEIDLQTFRHRLKFASDIKALPALGYILVKGSKSAV